MSVALSAARRAASSSSWRRRLYLLDVPEAEGDDLRPAVRPQGHEALALQDGQGVAYRSSAHGELFGQLSFGEDVAGLGLAAQDHVPDLGDHPLSQWLCLDAARLDGRWCHS